jgi:hypothetical protein
LDTFRRQNWTRRARTKTAAGPPRPGQLTPAAPALDQPSSTGPDPQPVKRNEVSEAAVFPAGNRKTPPAWNRAVFLE